METNQDPEDSKRTKVPSTSVTLDFMLTEEQKKAVLECIQKNGKLSLKLHNRTITKLPGRGLLDDVDGELID